jgi:hypothetical protein
MADGGAMDHTFPPGLQLHSEQRGEINDIRGYVTKEKENKGGIKQKVSM